MSAYSKKEWHTRDPFHVSHPSLQNVPVISREGTLLMTDCGLGCIFYIMMSYQQSTHLQNIISSKKVIIRNTSFTMSSIGGGVMIPGKMPTTSSMAMMVDSQCICSQELHDTCLSTGHLNSVSCIFTIYRDVFKIYRDVY